MTQQPLGPHTRQADGPTGLPLADAVLSVATVLDNQRPEVERFVHEVAELLPRLARYHEMLLIDNCSTDGAALAVQALQATVPNLRLLRLSRRCNLETAFAAAIDHSIGDYVVLLEIDRDPVAVIADMVAQAGHGYDVVIAERNERSPAGGLTRGLKRVADAITYRVVGYRVPTGASYLRLLSRRAANAIARIRSKRRYLEYLNAMVGFRQIRVPYDSVPVSRADHGPLLARFFRWLDFLLSNSALPLRGATMVALLASLINMVYLGYVVAVTIVKRQIAEGWISTSLMTGTMFLLLFLVLTILSEYVARLTEEVQERPLYFVEFESSSAITPATADLNIV